MDLIGITDLQRQIKAFIGWINSFHKKLSIKMQQFNNAEKRKYKKPLLYERLPGIVDKKGFLFIFSHQLLPLSEYCL